MAQTVHTVQAKQLDEAIHPDIEGNFPLDDAVIAGEGMACGDRNNSLLMIVSFSFATWH